MRRRKNFTITLVPPAELTSEDRMVADCVGMNPPPANNIDPSPPLSKYITTKIKFHCYLEIKISSNSDRPLFLRLKYLLTPIAHHPVPKTSQFSNLAIHSITFLPIGHLLDLNFFFVSLVVNISLSPSLLYDSFCKI